MPAFAQTQECVSSQAGQYTVVRHDLDPGTINELIQPQPATFVSLAACQHHRCFADADSHQQAPVSLRNDP